MHYHPRVQVCFSLIPGVVLSVCKVTLLKALSRIGAPFVSQLSGTNKQQDDSPDSESF